MTAATHTDYMSHALRLARKGCATVSPNPMVGCLIVKDNNIIGQGFHQQAGKPHAEIHALQEAAEDAAGATVYVTLEPCCHYGKTPPCTKALIEAGIKKVYIATVDPNPLVSGKGMQALQAAGIAVEVGLCEAEAKKLNEIFFHYIRTKRPFVIAKWAMSLDGKTITHPDDTRDISSAKSHEMTHRTRQQVDAILIGSTTAICDDPQLTVRLPGDALKQPVRIVLASRGELPLHLRLFKPDMPSKTIIAITDAADTKWVAAAKQSNVELLVVNQDEMGLVSLPHLLDELGKRGMTSLLVEGGRKVHDSFFKAQLVNQIHAYIAPVIIGTLEKKHQLGQLTVSALEQDFYYVADY